MAGDIRHRAEEAATGMVDRAKDAASRTAETAKDAASSVAHGARDMAHSIGQKTEEGVAAVGGGMKSLAGTIRESGPHEGMLGEATSRFANTLESGGRYLEQEGLSKMGHDLAEFVRRNPLPALFVGIGFGFLLAQMARRD